MTVELYRRAQWRGIAIDFGREDVEAREQLRDYLVGQPDPYLHAVGDSALVHNPTPRRAPRLWS